MEKEFIYGELNSIYGKLLTDKQREFIELYYSFDLSLSEISEIKKVSRNSVLDTLDSAKKHLDRLENTLFLHKKKQKLLDLIKSQNSELVEQIQKILEE